MAATEAAAVSTMITCLDPTFHPTILQASGPRPLKQRKLASSTQLIAHTCKSIGHAMRLCRQHKNAPEGMYRSKGSDFNIQQYSDLFVGGNLCRTMLFRTEGTCAALSRCRSDLPEKVDLLPSQGQLPPVRENPELESSDRQNRTGVM